jgi:hypothetical protein
MTIDEAIAQLEAARKVARLGGGTVLYMCLVGSEIEYLPVDSIVAENDPDGALCTLMVSEHELGAKAR